MSAGLRLHHPSLRRVPVSCPTFSPYPKEAGPRPVGASWTGIRSGKMIPS